MSAPYAELQQRLRDAETLRSLAALAMWDQETMMPRKAVAFRAEEVALVSRLAHERATDPRVGELIAECETDATLCEDPLESANLREIRRAYDRAIKLPPELVAELGQTGSLAMEAWKDARARDDFRAFRPWLEKQFALARRKAECYGAPEGGELYDALLDDFEPGMTAAQLERVFEPLREALVPLIADARSSDPPLALAVPLAAQREFTHWLCGRLGFDLEAGRLDESTHPFTTGLAPGDTRLTTRYRDDGFFDAVGSTLHELGHALYEQGLPKSERHGQPLAQTAGLGMHESQSRTWENQVGRSRPFWSWALPEARRFCGASLDGLDLGAVVREVNAVRAGLIRVEADETTYNLHVMIRFDLERALLRGDLPVDDLPAAWNRRIRDDLGLEVPDDRRGCLQDVHWSMGSIGYFPTYTLGNLYAAQLWEVVLREVADVERQLARGEFGALLDWLRERIHRHGRRFPGVEPCERISGRPLDWRPLVEYLASKPRGA